MAKEIYEADRSDLLNILNTRLPNISPEDIEAVVREIPEAKAILFSQASDHRAEFFDGEIMIARRVREDTGIDPNGNEYTEPQHLAIYTKLHKRALDRLTKNFGVECKNG